MFETIHTNSCKFKEHEVNEINRKDRKLFTVTMKFIVLWRKVFFCFEPSVLKFLLKSATLSEYIIFLLTQVCLMNVSSQRKHLFLVNQNMPNCFEKKTKKENQTKSLNVTPSTITVNKIRLFH